MTSKLISDKGLTYLNGIQNLRIVNDKITDRGLKYLSNASHITFNSCNEITDHGMKYFNSTIMNLTNCPKINPNGLKCISHNIIRLWLNKSFNEDNLRYLIDSKFIYVSSNYYLTNKGAKYLSHAKYFSFKYYGEDFQILKYLINVEDIYFRMSDVNANFVSNLNSEALRYVEFSAYEPTTFVKNYLSEMNIRRI